MFQFVLSAFAVRALADDDPCLDLYLTTQGEQLLEQLAQAAAAHEDAIFATLNPHERQQLTAFSTADHGLQPRVHPGYSKPTQ